LRGHHVYGPTPMRTYSSFINNTATTEIYTLSLHDALPISGNHPRPARRTGARTPQGRSRASAPVARELAGRTPRGARRMRQSLQDRKSTRLNSSHVKISYAVFCLKKKKKINSIDIDNGQTT